MEAYSCVLVEAAVRLDHVYQSRKGPALEHCLPRTQAKAQAQEPWGAVQCYGFDRRPSAW